MATKRANESEGGADDEMQEVMRPVADALQRAEAKAAAAPKRRHGVTRRNGEQPIPDGLVEDVSAVATAAIVGTAAAVIESELIPGILIGAATMLVGKMFPRVTRGMRPVAKMIIRGGIAISDKAREVVAETGEQFQDIVAEARAERDQAVQEQARSRGARRSQPAAAT
jgi:hypothetical protein